MLVVVVEHERPDAQVRVLRDGHQRGNRAELVAEVVGHRDRREAEVLGLADLLEPVLARRGVRHLDAEPELPWMRQPLPPRRCVSNEATCGSCAWTSRRTRCCAPVGTSATRAAAVRPNVTRTRRSSRRGRPMRFQPSISRNRRCSAPGRPAAYRRNLPSRHTRNAMPFASRSASPIPPAKLRPGCPARSTYVITPLASFPRTAFDRSSPAASDTSRRRCSSSASMNASPVSPRIVLGAPSPRISTTAYGPISAGASPDGRIDMKPPAVAATERRPRPSFSNVATT